MNWKYSKVTVQAPAKINLLLQIGQKNSNGYHDVISIMQAVSLYEKVTATANEKIVLTAVNGKHLASTPLDDNNLAVKAAQLLAKKTGVTAGVSLEITKTVPVAGGMAGGSADAAATLVACDKLWGTGLSKNDFLALANVLGADVPFALHGETALALGNGSVLTSVVGVDSLRWVVVHVAEELSTGKVFQELDELRLFNQFVAPSLVEAEQLIQKLRVGDVFEIGKLLRNDLAVAALSLSPNLQTILDVGKSFGVAGSFISGSGPSVVFLVEENFVSTGLVETLVAFPQVLDVYQVAGPVAGASIVDCVW